MITGKTIATVGAFLLLGTGSAVGFGVSVLDQNGVRTTETNKAGGAGVMGNTEKGKGTAKGGERGAVNKRPCHAHEGKAKKVCLKQYKRNRMEWPPRPKVWEIKRRIGLVQWRKAERVAYCETAGNWNHYPNGRYIGGLGMFRSTYGIGQAKTKYRWVHEGATKQEQIAIGYVVAQRFGWSAWGCGSA